MSIVPGLEQGATLMGTILGANAAAKAQELVSFMNYNYNNINSTLQKNHVTPGLLD